MSDFLFAKPILEKLTPNLPFFEYHHQLAEIYKKTETEKEKKFLDLLIDVSSAIIDIENTSNPYNISLKPDELKYLEGVSGVVDIPEIKYLLKDVLWIHEKKNISHGLEALEASLDSAKKIDPRLYPSDILKRIKRALVLSHQLKNRAKHDLVESTLTTICNLFKVVINSDCYLSGWIIELLIDYNAKNQIQEIISSDLLVTALAAAEKNSDWQLAHQLRRSVLIIYRFSEKTSETNRALIELASSYAKEGDQLRSGIVATRAFQLAIRNLMEVTGEDLQQTKSELMQEFHKKLLAAQSVIPQQMKLVQTQSIDLSDQLMILKNDLSQGRNALECLTILALKFPQQNESVFRSMQDNRQESNIHSLFASKSVVDDRGRTVANLSNEHKEYSHNLNTDLNILWSIKARLIEFGRNWISSEYPFIKSDWNNLLGDCSTIRPGHEQIVIEGLHFGLNGNYLVSSHLLIPQIEDSFRYLLENNEILCSKIAKSLNQKDEILDDLVKHTKLNELLGEEFVFEASRLLIEPGLNFRNDESHGKLPYAAFWSHTSVYLWYLALRLHCLGPSILKSKFQVKAPSDP